MKIHFIFSHETYIVNDLNQFSRGDWIHIPSNNWALTGAVEYKFGRVHKQYSVVDIWDKNVPWFYKSGKQRCFVVQYDHGSKSVMISPKLLDVRVYP